LLQRHIISVRKTSYSSSSSRENDKQEEDRRKQNINSQENHHPRQAHTMETTSPSTTHATTSDSKTLENDIITILEKMIMNEKAPDNDEEKKFKDFTVRILEEIGNNKNRSR
jgi:hypothetical protein